MIKRRNPSLGPSEVASFSQRQETQTIVLTLSLSAMFLCHSRYLFFSSYSYLFTDQCQLYILPFLPFPPLYVMFSPKNFNMR